MGRLVTPLDFYKKFRTFAPKAPLAHENPKIGFCKKTTEKYAFFASFRHYQGPARCSALIV